MKIKNPIVCVKKSITVPCPQAEDFVYESAWSEPLNKADYLAAMGKIDLKGAFPNGSLNARNFRVQWVRKRTNDEGKLGLGEIFFCGIFLPIPFSDLPCRLWRHVKKTMCVFPSAPACPPPRRRPALLSLSLIPPKPPNHTTLIINSLPPPLP